jgi:2-keto-4-pentenoate hydratase/2-oxohepta-3-ene-1,7-dioic acid hydratase in catechol pathway
MPFPVRPELPTASVGSSQAPTAAVGNSAPSVNRPESTYKSGNVVQTNGATSLVTSDEIPDYRALKATARVNGEVWTDSSTAEMGFGFEDLIEYVSTDEQVRAGEFMAGGTVPNGSGQESGRFLKEGDVVELEVSGLGLLRNRITRESA